ncbi:MAG: hypothetical protein Kow00111_18090 [Thermincola ferriacetica]
MVLKKYDVDPTIREDWPNQHAWLKEKLELFHNVFSKRIKKLKVEDYNVYR